MEFWDRVADEILRHNTTQEWVAGQSKINLRTIQGWVSKGRLPRADEACALASCLDTTVEYLVTGAHPSEFIPARIRSIVDALILIEDEARLEPIRILANAAAPRRGPSSLPVADIPEIGKDKVSKKKA